MKVGRASSKQYYRDKSSKKQLAEQPSSMRLDYGGLDYRFFLVEQVGRA